MHSTVAVVFLCWSDSIALCPSGLAERRSEERRAGQRRRRIDDEERAVGEQVSIGQPDAVPCPAGLYLDVQMPPAGLRLLRRDGDREIRREGRQCALEGDVRYLLKRSALTRRRGSCSLTLSAAG